MSRSVWSRVFALQLSPLSEAAAQGKVAAVVAKHFKTLKGTVAAPMALRWILNPFYGLARQPFKVYRRQRRADDLGVHGKSLLAAPQNILANPKLEWGKARMFDVAARLTPVVGKPITLIARDSHGVTLPGQQVTLGVAGWVRLRGSGIASLEVTAGEGTVDQIVGIEDEVMADLADWTLVQVVGLPTKANEIAAPAYDSVSLQGYVPASLGGQDASKQRLDIAAMLQLACPVIPGVPASPSWPPPDPVKYLDALRDGPGGAAGESLFGAVRALLTGTKDTDPGAQQRNFRLTKKLAGLSQIGQGGPPQGETVFNIPVAGVAMMHAATDSFSSTALGYGTVDITLAAGILPANTAGPAPPSYTRPNDQPEQVFDYMVTCILHLTSTFPKGGSPMHWDLEIAALGDLHAAPPTPAGLVTKVLRLDRPPGVDQAIVETRELAWKPWRHVLAYGLAARRKPSEAPAFLNAPRIDGVGYQPYVPAQAAVLEGNPAVDATCKFVDLYGKQPFTGSATTNYWVIATDVFGRWSGWTTANHLSNADPPRLPGIDKVDFFPGPTPIHPDLTLTGTLVVDFAWDWIDRKPGRLEISGRYFTPDGTTPAGPPAGFDVQLGKPANKVIGITFDANGNPHIDPTTLPPGATVIPNGVVGGPSAEVRKYQLKVPGAAIVFGAATQVGYAAWIRGSEALRPAEMSANVGPRVTYTFDPQPPKITLDPPPILWTDLPDVNGKARARLSWTGDPKALGYFVWVATETPLATLLGIPSEATTDIELRAATLKAAVEQAATNGDEDAIRVFSRVHAKAITATELQIELPAAADTLFFYRVSAINKTAVESERSTKVFAVAVPRRIVPGQPTLLLRPQAEGVEVIAVAGPGPKPDGYALLRARDETLARDPGLMGPPKVQPGPQWIPDTIQLVDDTDRDAHRYFDARPPSWFPHYYRVRAVGGSLPDDDKHGRLRGESVASDAQRILRPPPAAPKAILDPVVAVANNKLANVFTLHTDLPMRRSPLGVARIEVVFQSLENGKLKSTVQLAALTHELTAEPVLPANLVAVADDTHWHGNRLRLFRSPTDAFTPRYLICLKNYPASETVHDSTQPEDPSATIVRPVVGAPRFVRLTDPLGRITELPLVQQPEPLPTLPEF